ncbi:hypothetical protein ACLOJK_013970 [Asimina triloba]
MSSINLPPGFRFHPTDEELVAHFLHRKAADLPCHPDIIPDIQLYRYDPWELNGKALEGENEWYFFSHRTQNRTTSNGYWKVTGLEDAVTSGSRTVGTKKSLVFYIGEAPYGIKTNWVSTDWMLCRVHERDSGSQSGCCDEGAELSCLDEVFLSLDDDFEEISWKRRSDKAST